MNACSHAPHILLREAGLDFTIEKVDLADKKTETGADFKKINPHGYVPALQLKDALLVNPYSKDEISDAIARALDMPKDERIRRWRSMMDSVEKEDVLWWRKKFVAALQKAGGDQPDIVQPAELVR